MEAFLSIVCDYIPIMGAVLIIIIAINQWKIEKRLKKVEHQLKDK